MTHPTNDIDALLVLLHDSGWKDFHRALTTLVAERDKLVEDNASQTYKGNSVRYWHDKASAYKATIGSLWEILESAAVCPDGERTITAALTALVAERDKLKEENLALRSRQKAHQDEVLDRVFEMDALRKRIAELEAHPPAASDLRKDLICAALSGASSQDGWRSPDAMAAEVVKIADATLAAMRKGVANGK